MAELSNRSRFIDKAKGRRRFDRDKMRKGIYVLPNLFTTATLFSGFYSVIASMHGQFVSASIAILIAWVLDGMDGRMARMTNTTSKFGAEYDSLADVIAFGMSPAILVYVWALSPYGKWGWMTSFLFVACGALRLARFNVQINVIDKNLFNGLPIPGAAIVIASTIILFHHLGIQGRLNNISVLFFVAALAFLMVSNIKYYSFKDLNYFTRKPFISFVLMVLIMMIVIAEPQITIFTFAIGYSLSGPVWFLVKLTRKKSSPILKNEEKNIEGNAKA
jgi:CDP-diacylglycerol---serine O-phosphatidyltransferase